MLSIVTAYECQNMTIEHIVQHDLDLFIFRQMSQNYYSDMDIEAPQNTLTWLFI